MPKKIPKKNFYPVKRNKKSFKNSKGPAVVRPPAAVALKNQQQQQNAPKT